MFQGPIIFGLTVNEILLAVFLTLALVFTYKTLVEKDLVKAVVYSGGEAVSYALAFVVMYAPDLVLAYVAVGLGIYSALFLFVITRTERYEKEVVEA